MLRQKLIEAAARVYGEHGFRGATTRRIAEEAGVNEVTLFRHFGSKEALIAECVKHCATTVEDGTLPDVPRDPERELTEWAAAHLARLRASRSLIRKSLGELEERPQAFCAMSENSQSRARSLRTYMIRLAEHGFVSWPSPSRGGRNEEAHAAGAMLMSAMFADAMGRDMMPEMYPQPAERAAAMYVRVFLRAIACDARKRRGGSTSSKRSTRPSTSRGAAGKAPARAARTSKSSPR